jgi:hypothetical protein
VVHLTPSPGAEAAEGREFLKAAYEADDARRCA